MVSKNLHNRAAKHILTDHLDVEINLTKSKGNYIYDDKSGRYLLDCFSYIASNPIGHNHAKMLDSKFQKKLLKAALNNPSNSDVLTEEYVSFIETFDRVLNKQKHFNKYFFIAGGSAAVENALKTAFDWKLHKNLQKDIHIHPNDLDIIHFKGAFHGRGGYTVSLTNSADPAKYRFFPKFNWTRLSALNPAIDSDGIHSLREGFIAELKNIISQNRNKIAAIIVETIQGEGGDRQFPQEFHYELDNIRRSEDILIIYDEVQTGVGLTGRAWAYENYDVKPDIICFGKKTQVCGIAVGDRITNDKESVFNVSSRINSTWMGNLVDAVRSQRYLEIIEEDKLIDNAAVVGNYLQDRLRALEDSDLYPIYGSRGVGLMCSFSFVNTNRRTQFLQDCFKNGLFILGSGTDSVRFRPSLNFTEKNVDEAMEIIEKGLKGLK